MVSNMYPYQSKIYLKEVALNVLDLERQTSFHTEILGLSILDQQSDQVLLGVDQEPLVRLLQAQEAGPKSYGLYHLAILLPNRQALADVIKHLADLRIPLVGGADHGYSEALYLEDLEGNGIELYADKDQSLWDIREDGRIVGVTEELASQDLYDLGRSVKPFKLASKSRMGHVHLSVGKVAEAKPFYMQILALDDKFSVPSGAWLASGGYHHHLAVNEWSGPHLAARSKGQAGLAYYQVEVDSRDHLAELAAAARDLGLSLVWSGTSSYEVVDPFGIVTRVSQRL